MAIDTLKPEALRSTTMPHNDDFITQHEVGDFKHHSNMYNKHSAGHIKDSEKIKAMCGGGYAKK